MQNQKGFSSLIGIVIIVAVAIIIVGGVFGYQYLTQPKENNQQQVQNEQQNQNTENTTDQTAGWKTYTNDEYGFEFKYPKDWVIDDSGTGPTVSVWSSEKKKQEAVDAIISIYPEFSVNYKDIASFKAFAKGLLGRDVSGAKDFVSSNANFYSFAETTIGGKKAYAVISVTSRSDYIIYIESGNGVYILSTEDLSEVGQDPKNPKIDENVKNIISTFKFIK